MGIFQTFKYSVLIIFASACLFSGCVSDYSFSQPPDQSSAALSSGSGGGSGGDNGGGGGGVAGTGSYPGAAPPCTLGSSNTQVITSLPAGVTQAMVSSVCPVVGHDSECGIVIIIGSSGNSLYFTGQGPYDGNDDTLVGVINMSSNPVSTIALSSNMDIAGFDGDGLDSYVIQGTSTKVGGNNMDNSNYGGPNAYYTNISSDATSVTVNFITPVAANGGTTFFGLENALTAANSCLSSVSH